MLPPKFGAADQGDFSASRSAPKRRRYCAGVSSACRALLPASLRAA